MFISLHFKQVALAAETGRGPNHQLQGGEREEMEWGWFKWIISQQGKKKKIRGGRGKIRERGWAAINVAPQTHPPTRYSSPPSVPRGLALSDLKWHPAVQTWMLWLHIKPFNHRAPCSAKKPLMRSLPRMNKQPLMKNPEHLFFFSRVEDLVNKRRVRPWAECLESCEQGVCLPSAARLKGYQEVSALMYRQKHFAHAFSPRWGWD